MPFLFIFICPGLVTWAYLTKKPPRNCSSHMSKRERRTGYVVMISAVVILYTTYMGSKGKEDEKIHEPIN